MRKNEDEQDIKTMIADYMENGFLENIIDMFRHDSGLYLVIADLIRDERVRVRVGVTALVEELSAADREHLVAAVPGLIPLLRDDNATLRGDAANLLGIIGDPSALPELRRLSADPDPNVRWIAGDAIEQLSRGQDETNE
ncbi:MAG: HEAT repeat domain-containing protein [Thermodesulfovibrionales bacterium]